MKNLEVIARARVALATRSFGRMAPAVMVAVMLAACAPSGPTPEEARTLAKAAWIYGFPMAVNYKTMYEYSVDTSSPEYRGSPTWKVSRSTRPRRGTSSASRRTAFLRRGRSGR
jgi:hypothetical protein